MRIAWIGPIGHGGGVEGMGRILMRQLLAQGVEIDYFFTYPQDKVEEILGKHPGLKYIQAPHWWQWGRWYSRNQTLAYLSSFYARSQSYSRMCDTILESHRSRNYSVIVQFSQLELLRLRKFLQQLPPVVVYTCVHAAGEYTWHKRESRYARQSEGLLRHLIARMLLSYRTRVQRRQSHAPAMLIGMSRRFNELIEQDYGVSQSKMRVLYHPIETAKSQDATPKLDSKIRMVFAGRISVRKGVEMIVELSRRLDDLSDQIQIDVIGGHTMWSDYRKHMTELNPRNSKYLGSQGNDVLLETFANADILLTPSHYEPGGIVVGEAISRGMCIVASDEVGSAEPLNGRFVIKYKHEDMDAFERAVREMIQRVRTERQQLAAEAKKAAVDEFDPPKIAGQLLGYLKEAAK